MMGKDLQKLKTLIDSISPVSDDAWKDFSSIWSPFSAKRKEIITSVGDIEHSLYFVTEGVQRVFFFDEKGREATIVFIYPPSFGGVLDSLLLQKPSRYGYETLTASTFLKAPFLEVNRIMLQHPSIHQLMTKGLVNVISGMMERMAELQCFSSEEKFRMLLKRSPHILQLVPHKYLANYLGIDPTNFSKLLNSVKI